MKTNRHHETGEQRGDQGADGRELRADGGDRLDLGTRVVDRDADDPNTAVVVDLPDEPAYAYTIDALDGEPSVADLNPDYGASGAIAVVAFADELDDVAEWRERDPAALAGIAADHDLRTYTYPRERLRRGEDADGAQGGSA